MEDLRKKATETGALPPISKAASRLLVLPLENDKGEAELLRMIESDPFITARMIGMANSPYFTTGRTIHTLDEAAMVLGLSLVKSVALAIALLGSVKVRESRIFSLKDLWTHSFAMAIGMRTLASMLPPQRRPPDDLLFLSGLLHDMGYLALAYLSPERFDAFLSQVESHPEIPATEIEQAELGVGHAEIGAIMARSWSLPEDVVSVIESHHDEKPDMKNIPLVLSRLVESITGEGAIHRPPSMMTRSPEELEAVGLSLGNLDETREILEMQWALSFTA